MGFAGSCKVLTAIVSLLLCLVSLKVLFLSSFDLFFYLVGLDIYKLLFRCQIMEVIIVGTWVTVYYVK